MTAERTGSVRERFALIWSTFVRHSVDLLGGSRRWRQSGLIKHADSEATLAIGIDDELLADGVRRGVIKMMKVRELIDLLEDFDQEAEVRLACQPSWPLAFNVAGAVADSELAEFVDERDADDVPEPAQRRMDRAG